MEQQTTIPDFDLLPQLLVVLFQLLNALLFSCLPGGRLLQAIDTLLSQFLTPLLQLVEVELFPAQQLAQLTIMASIRRWKACARR